MYQENQENFGTDLAAERRQADTDIAGVEFRREDFGAVALERITVSSEEGARALGRPQGHYHTLTTGRMETLGEEEKQQAAEILADLISEMSDALLPGYPMHVLTVGLGNAALTADAVGPLTCQKIPATRHIAREEPEIFRALDCTEVSVLTPGVSAQSGMDAADVVDAVAGRTKPDLLIVVDALAARATERLGTTVQISDTGIMPGSGVGNHRQALTEEDLGIPVLVLGVPTVTDSRVFIYEEAARCGMAWEPREREAPGMFVSPKEIGDIVSCASDILSSAINRVFGVLT